MKTKSLNQSCNFELTDWSIPVSFPSLNALPSSGFPTGITISGNDIMLNSYVFEFLFLKLELNFILAILVGFSIME